MSFISFVSLFLIADTVEAPVGRDTDTASCPLPPPPPRIIGDNRAEEVEVEVEIEGEKGEEEGAEEGWRLCVGTVRARPLVMFSIS